MRSILLNLYSSRGFWQISSMAIFLAHIVGNNGWITYVVFSHGSRRSGTQVIITQIINISCITYNKDIIKLFYRCAIPHVDVNGTMAILNETILQTYIPNLPSGSLDNCRMYNVTTNETMQCESWVFDTTYYKSSRAIEWNFVCDRRWMGAIAQTIYMFGVFTGALTLGNAADKYGRKIIFCWSATLQLLLGVIVAFSPNYYTFLILRFLYGIFGSAGSYITGFVLTMEIVGASKRTVCGIAFQVAFAGGIMLVAAWGALISDRQILQVVYGLHGLLLIGHWWLMDESPRWLWAQGRVSESVAILKKALKMNGKELNLDPSDYNVKGKASNRKEEDDGGVMDLFKMPNLRRKTLNVCLCWFANSLAYYGLSLSSGKLYGNPFLILFLLAFVEFPSYLITVLILDKTGRRSLTAFYMLTGGLSCIIAASLEQGSTAATSVVMIGKFLIASSFAIIYNYSAELFPTVIRNSALGIGSMCARLSGALTPLITLLDSFNPTLPAVIFGVVTLISGFLVLFLPETAGHSMPQTIEDGEKFGVGDTCFTTCLGKKPKNNERELDAEQMEPLEHRKQ